jgi:transcriptional regulator with XRE-family HTH domain
MTELNAGAICARIKEARDAVGLKQQQFADVLNVTLRTVGYWESDRVPWDRLDEISKITDRTVRWLLYGDEWLSAPEWAQMERIEDKLDRLLQQMEATTEVAGDPDEVVPTEEELAAAHEQELDDAVQQASELDADTASNGPVERRRRKAQ